jgi:DNA-binding XRE family transcriptional regulator
VTEPPVAFASLLRKLRREARLTQEELAEAAALSVRAVSYLEAGVVTSPQKDTVRLLADALGLIGPARGGSRRLAGAGPRRAGWRRQPGRCRATSPRSAGGSGSWISWRRPRRGRAGS